MTFYLLSPDAEIRHQFRGHFEHKWSLPGVNCPACQNRWAQRGVHYPTADLSSLPNCANLVPDNVDLETFIALRDQVEKVVKIDGHLLPGTRFGSLHGSADGDCGGFAWVNLWTLVATSEAVRKLSDLGVTLNGAMIRYEAIQGPELIEPEILPRVYLARGIGIREIQPCLKCGYYNFRKPKDQPLRLDASTIKNDTDLCRIVDLPTHIIANDRFRSAIDQLELTGISFAPIEAI